MVNHRRSLIHLDLQSEIGRTTIFLDNPLTNRL